MNTLVPLGRLGEPREVALLALYLSSQVSDYIVPEQPREGEAPPNPMHQA